MAGYAHWCILQHIRYNEETNHATADVDLVELRNATIASSYSDILEGDVQVVLGCEELAGTRQYLETADAKMKHTFCKFAAVELASLELDGDNMSKRLVEKLDGDAESCCCHFCVR